jgi:mannosylglycoprotein endo-beta-mannosidase
MTKIDRALISIDWDLAFPDAFLQAISSSVSNHAPLLLSMSAGFRPKRRFRFELFWLKLEGVDDAIKDGWLCDETIMDPFGRLDSCFRNLAKHLQSWSDRKVGNIKLQIAIANLIIHRFDVAQESRDLSNGEWWLRKMLKLTILALSSLECTMARQRSRIRWLQEGDANSKLFHLVANGRR